MHLDREANGKNVGRREVRSSGVAGVSAPRGGEFGDLRNWSGIQFLLADCRLLPPLTPELLTSRLLDFSIPERYSITAWIGGSVEYLVFWLDQNGTGMAHDVCVRLDHLDRVSSSLETFHNLLRDARFQSHVICFGAPVAPV